MSRPLVAALLAGALIAAGCGPRDSGKKALPPTATASSTPSVNNPAPALVTADAAKLIEGQDYTVVAKLPSTGPGLQSISYLGVTTNHLAYGIATDVGKVDQYENAPPDKVALTDLRTNRTNFIYHAGERGTISTIVVSADWIVWAEIARRTTMPNPGAQPAYAVYSFQRSNGVVRRIQAAPITDDGLWITFDRGGDLGIVGDTVYFDAVLGPSREGIFSLNLYGQGEPVRVIKNGYAPEFIGDQMAYSVGHREFIQTVPSGTRKLVPTPKGSEPDGSGGRWFAYTNKTSHALSFVGVNGEKHEIGPMPGFEEMSIGERFAILHPVHKKAVTEFVVDIPGGKVFRLRTGRNYYPIMTGKDMVILHQYDSHNRFVSNEILKFT